MKELKDYRSEFTPDLRYEDLSKDALIKLLKEASRTLTWMGAYWYTIIGDKYGVEEANLQSLDVWIKEADFCIPAVAKALNVEPTDVASAMKLWQLDPVFSSELFKYDLNIKDRNHAILTIYHCPSLAYQEREGKGNEKFTCQVLEPATMIRYFGSLGLEWVDVRPLKVPPRIGWEEKGWGHIHCQWDFQQVPENVYEGKIPDSREKQLNRLIKVSWEIHEREMMALAGGTTESDSQRLESLKQERRALLEQLKWRSSR